jgi:hypothetical protein
LFDLGLGILQMDACVPVNDPAIVAALRGCTGKSVFALGNDAMGIMLAANPHRVFVSRSGRAEVFQPIPPPDGKSPDGPHTHDLPKLLSHRRTHATTEPVPEGCVACAHLYPRIRSATSLVNGVHFGTTGTPPSKPSLSVTATRTDSGLACGMAVGL